MDEGDHLPAPAPAETPAEWNTLAVDADSATFSAFYRNSIAQLITFLVWQGARPADAADIAQESMIKAHRHWATIESPRAWVRRVASRDWGRIAHNVETPVDPIPEHSALLSRVGDIETLEQRHNVLQLLNCLPPRQRQVLAWTLNGYTPTEIAIELGLTPEAVRTALFKARRALAERLPPEDGGPR